MISYFFRKYYTKIIPSIALVIYFIFMIIFYLCNNSITILHESKGFETFCELIANFSTIILGIYGFLIPIMIGKMDEKHIKKFWGIIDKAEFSQDIKDVILSGILTILCSSIFVVSDVFNEIVVCIIFGFLIWILLFYACSSYRFIGIFILLIMGTEDKADDSPQILITEEQKKELDDSMEEL